MNFKPVVASLFALGLVSSPVLAQTHEAKEQNKHQKHHVRHARHEHRGVRAEQRLSGEYSAHEHFIDTNAARSPVAAFDWVNRFHLSGMINVDASYSTRGPLGTAPGFRLHHDSSDINVNNANLFVDVDINRLVTGHIGIAYVADSVNLLDWDVNTNFAGTSFSESVRGNKGAVWANSRLGVDEAYITIRDFSQSPYFFRAGKMYVPFGDNRDIYPITHSLTQLISQTRATAAQLGWVGGCGLYGSAYVLTGAESSFRVSHRDAIVFEGIGAPREFNETYTVINNWGANLGYCGCYDDVRYQLSASYIKDIRDSEYLSSVQDLVRYSFVGGGNGDGDRQDGRRHNRGLGYRFHQTGGAALHGDATWGPFNLTANYVTALGSLLSDGHRRRNNDNDNDNDATRQDGRRRNHDHGSRISAADITGTYNTYFWGYNTGFSLGYQRAWDASPLLPEWRIQGDIGVCILPYTTLTLEYHYDRDFGRDNNSLVRFLNDDNGDRQDNDDNDGRRRHRHHDSRSSGTGILRLGVAF